MNPGVFNLSIYSFYNYQAAALGKDISPHCLLPYPRLPGAALSSTHFPWSICISGLAWATAAM